MSDTVSLSTFPDNHIEALALLYVQSQDLTGKSPEEILDIYDDAYVKIKEHNRNKKNAKMANWTN